MWPFNKKRNERNEAKPPASEACYRICRLCGRAWRVRAPEYGRYLVLHHVLRDHPIPLADWLNARHGWGDALGAVLYERRRVALACDGEALFECFSRAGAHRWD